MEIVRVRFIDKENTGCEKAPIAILERFKNISCKENGSGIVKDMLRFEEIHVNLADAAEADYLIFENGKETFERNFKSFFIGGDTSVLYPLLRAFTKTEKNPLTIVFDAHAGCGSSPHLDKIWLSQLAEERQNIVLVGTRAYAPDEKSFLKDKHILSIDRGLLGEDCEGICDLLMERAHAASGFFVCIDLDVVDPSGAPGVTHIEPGGISSSELIYFVKRLSLLKNFKGAAILGANPDKDVNGMTVALGARLLAEMV
ncbi:MAG: hypothetical protein RL557_847 [archaeon]|jgi:arginase family enzyme